MATISEVLLAVNKVTQSLDYQVIKSGARLTTIRVIADDRITARSDMLKALAKNGLRPRIDFQVKSIPGSTFDGIEIKETSSSVIRFLFKAKRGGSGAGAAITKLTESAQCVYAAVAFHRGRHITQGDVTPESIDAASGFYKIDENINNIKKMSDDAWIASCVKGANKLWDEFRELKSKGIVFHRGDKVVNHIENQFKRIKKVEGIKIDINKWSPADIYVTTNEYNSQCLDQEQSLKGLNQCMMERLINKSMFGVSLKKITSNIAKLEQVNVNREISNTKEFEKFEMSQDSADCYMHFKGNTKIQFRGFDGPKALTGFQGEVKGASANQGKIGLGSVNLILKLHDINQIPNIANMIRAGSRSDVIKIVEDGVEKYVKNFDKAKYISFVDKKIKDDEYDGYLYSKGSCIKVIDTINSISNQKKKNQVCEDLILYASSQSIVAAPFWKLQ